MYETCASGCRMRCARQFWTVACGNTASIDALSTRPAELCYHPKSLKEVVCMTVRIEPQPGHIDDFDQRYAPQFRLGDPTATTRIEIAWSLQCSATRAFYNARLGTLIERVRTRNDAFLVFHHLVRIPSEMLLAELLLRVEPNHYGALCLTALRAFADRNQDPGREELAKLVEHLDLPADPRFNRDTARASAALLNVHLVQQEGIIGTPAVMVSGKPWQIGITPASFDRTLKESGYEL